MYCDRCGTQLTVGAQFCTKCGKAMGFLALLRFPLGTALGIYTLWVLLSESSGAEYDRLAQRNGQLNSAAVSS